MLNVKYSFYFSGITLITPKIRDHFFTRWEGGDASIILGSPFPNIWLVRERQSAENNVVRKRWGSLQIITVNCNDGSSNSEKFASMPKIAFLMFWKIFFFPGEHGPVPPLLSRNLIMSWPSINYIWWKIQPGVPKKKSIYLL